MPALCEALADAGCSVRLVTATRDPDQDNRPNAGVICDVVTESRHLTQLQLSRSFPRKLALAVRAHDTQSVVHDHGLWLLSNHAVATFCRRNQIPRIVATRGMASLWSLQNSRWKKKIPWLVYQYKDLATATGFHATSQLEADEIRALGFTQPIAVIPNGVTTPGKFPGRTSNTRKMLFLSRIHPKKGLINLVNAWKNAQVSADWKLIIAGPDEGGHMAEVQEEATRLQVNNQIEFQGSVDDGQKWQLFADADVFVLPSFSENFGIVVAEALASGLPVITTTGTPWSELIDRKCGWYVSPAIEPLTDAIRQATTLDAGVLEQMKPFARQWVADQFSWPAIGVRMLAYYRWILQQGEKPDFVQ